MDSFTVLMKEYFGEIPEELTSTDCITYRNAMISDFPDVITLLVTPQTFQPALMVNVLSRM